MTKSDRLDQILLSKGWVTESQIAHALKQQRAIGEPFGSTLVVFGFITETQLAEALAEQYGTPKWDPQTAVVERKGPIVGAVTFPGRVPEAVKPPNGINSDCKERLYAGLGLDGAGIPAIPKLFHKTTKNLKIPVLWAGS